MLKKSKSEEIKKRFKKMILTNKQRPGYDDPHFQRELSFLLNANLISVRKAVSKEDFKAFFDWHESLPGKKPECFTHHFAGKSLPVFHKPDWLPQP